ncbi:MAG: hypothetical protein V4563_15035 [Pseudomonadota bacterium]
MNTPEYLDLVRERLHLPSDYALQKPLGVSKQLISNYRTGKEILSDTVALRVAEIIGMHPGLVVLDMHRQRSKTSEEATIWDDIYKGFRTLLPHAKIERRLSAVR